MPRRLVKFYPSPETPSRTTRRLRGPIGTLRLATRPTEASPDLIRHTQRVKLRTNAATRPARPKDTIGNTPLPHAPCTRPVLPDQVDKHQRKSPARYITRKEDSCGQSRQTK